MPAEFKPGTRIQFVAVADDELAEYLRVSRTPAIALWGEYLKQYPAAAHSNEVKNALGGGRMPSQHFQANAAWFKLALLAYNLASAIKGLCFSPDERTARFKRYRLLLVHLAGRMSRFQCKLRLRFCASAEAIKRVQRVWDVFALATHATAFR